MGEMCRLPIDYFEEFVSIIPLVANNTIQAYDDFKNSLMGIQSRIEYLANVQSEGEVDSIQDRLQKYLKDNESQINKNKHSLEKIREDMIKTKDSEKEMNCKIAEYECMKHDLEKNISKWSHKRKKLEEDKHKILVYKLLTGIHFSYEKGNVSGYVVNHNSKKIKPFILNEKKLSQEEIMNSLYDIIKKTSVKEAEVPE